MSEPLIVIARRRAKPGQEARMLQELQRLVTPTRAEAGCIAYDLHQSQTDPSQFMFYEVWRSQADLDAHAESPHMKEARNNIAGMSAGEMDLTKWTRLK